MHRMKMTPEQVNTEAAAKVAALTDEALCAAWMYTERQINTSEIATTREWLMDEIEKRLGPARFDQWLDAYDENGKGLNPIEFFN